MHGLSVPHMISVALGLQIRRSPAIFHSQLPTTRCISNSAEAFMFKRPENSTGFSSAVSLLTQRTQQTGGRIARYDGAGDATERIIMKQSDSVVQP